MDRPATCLVTIHGIGFQQAPEEGLPGYADELHRSLNKYLEPLLSGDPGRGGAPGAIYVRSHWPAGSNRTEAGLARLGRWDASRTSIDGSGEARLTTGDRSIAHVALVYSHLEEQGARLASLFETTARAAVYLGHYASFGNLVHTVFSDAMALAEGQSEMEQASPSLCVRRDAVSGPWHLVPGLFRPPQPHSAEQAARGRLVTLRQIENDVAAYVCRNDLRERLRGFVREALLRLAARKDVGAIVVNSHSQGTVVAFDVLSELPPSAAWKVQGFVTSGSPLRKYADLFSWGTEVGAIETMPWTNYWDRTDPVGDPLAPPAGWQAGGTRRDSREPGLYRSVNPETGDTSWMIVEDRGVDNMKNSRGGGLQAHNYWDNDPEVVKPLADLIKRVSAGVTVKSLSGAPHR